MLQPALTDWLRVPPRPEPPFGDADSVRTFRAARPFLYRQLLFWALRQAGALLGLVFLLHQAPEFDPFQWVRNLENLPHVPIARAVRTFDRLGGFSLLEALAILGFIAQIPLSFALTVLDYRYRWYLITDRSLRIREGIVNLHERTMTFSNVQQVTVRQGPLDQLLGISDVEVRTAGGGDKNEQSGEKGEGDNFHIGRFRGVDNANEIRDLLLERLRRVREPAPAEQKPLIDEQTAARTLLAEARSLRKAIASAGDAPLTP